MKKLNLLFTAILLLCCVGTAKAEQVTIDGIKYDVIAKAKQATVISGGNYSGNIVIPSEITYNNVTCSVTSIEYGAFNWCSGLTSVTIPNSVTSIGRRAFEGSSELESIVVAPGNTKYDSRENCNAIIETESNTLIAGCKNSVIPNGVTSIGEEAFAYCKGLTSITIPNSVKSIGEEAYYFCSGLTGITIPNSVTAIGDGAFFECSGLESIVVDSGNTRYDSRENCNAIIETESNTLIAGCKNSVIPNGITNIGHYAFSRCSGLTSVTIPNSVTSIGNYAFYECSGLTSITIPNSVTSIGDWAFFECSGLTSITIPNSVTSIGSSAFQYCYELASVTIGNSVTGIGEREFYGCSGLTSITIPNSVTSIGNEAFAYCSGLKSVTIPNSVTSIGDGAFQQCYELASVTIGNSVTSIGSSAFLFCYGLRDVYCLATDVPSTHDEWGNYCNPFDDSYMTLYVSAKAINNYKTTRPWSNFGNFVEIAEGNVFIDGINYYLSAGTMQATVIKGGNYSGDIVIPSEITYNNVTYNVTSIGEDAFLFCSGLTSITIPNSVTSIEEEAFWYCSGLKSVTIGNSVTSIGNVPFFCCSGIESIVVDPGNTKYDSRENCNAIIETESNTLITGCKKTVIPNSVTSIGEDAFSGCSGLTSITVPNSVTSIESYAFAYCSGLTSITIQNSVTSIGSYAFYSCEGLTSITIPNSVTSIGGYAFKDCSNLTDVFCLATNIPSTDNDAFDGSYPEYMTLHVPAEAIDSYKTTAPWSSFGNIVAIIIEKPKCAAPVIEYYNGELVIECETENAEFVTEVTCDDIKKFYNDKINFSATYNISVYATATGHDNSDTVNATLCWIECDCSANDNTTEVINVPAKAVFVTSNNGTINISCSLEGEIVELYTIDAMYIGNTTIENGCATIESGLSKGDIAIIKIGEKSIKVILN